MNKCIFFIAGLAIGSTHTFAVVNGESASDNLSWMAALIDQPSNKQFCGGSLIAPQWVMTAAHCVESYEKNATDIVVSFGKVDLSETPLDTYQVDSISIHPGYISSDNFFQSIRYFLQYKHTALMDNDIALLYLKKPVPFEPAIFPNEADSPMPEEALRLTGWGRNFYDRTYETTDHLGNSLELQEKFAGTYSSDERAQLDVLVKDDSVCENQFISLISPVLTAPEMLDKTLQEKQLQASIAALNALHKHIGDEYHSKEASGMSEVELADFYFNEKIDYCTTPKYDGSLERVTRDECEDDVIHTLGQLTEALNELPDTINREEAKNLIAEESRLLGSAQLCIYDSNAYNKGSAGQGDSGGPLYRQSNLNTVLGIASYVSSPESETDQPFAVYTNPYFYRDWIDQTMNQNAEATNSQHSSECIKNPESTYSEPGFKHEAWCSGFRQQLSCEEVVREGNALCTWIAPLQNML